MTINDIISFLVSPPITSWLIVLKVVFIVFSFIFFIIIITFLIKTSWLKNRFLKTIVDFFVFKAFRAKKLTKKWKKIMARLKTGQEFEYKLAVIEADSLFDDIVENMGYSGESLSERLKKLSIDMVPNLEQILQAHKIHNDIIHDPDYKLGLEEAKEILIVFEIALIELGLL